MSLSDPFLSIEDVTFSYGNGRVILNDVTLRFGRGQVVAIMGGSGMGKTTLLKLIGGLIRPQKGRILFDGTDVATADTQALYRARRKMGIPISLLYIEAKERGFISPTPAEKMMLSPFFIGNSKYPGT